MGWVLVYLLWDMFVLLCLCWVEGVFFIIFLFDVILNWFLWGSLFNIVCVLSLISFLVWDLLDCMKMVLYFLMFFILCFFFRMFFFFLSEDNDILIRFGLLYLFFKWEVVMIVVLLFRWFIILWVMFRIGFFVFWIFIVIIVRFGLLFGLLFCELLVDIWWFEFFFRLFKCWIIEFIDCDSWLILFLWIVSLRLILLCIVLNFLLIEDINFFLNLFNLFFNSDWSECWFFCRFCIVFVIIVSL